MSNEDRLMEFLVRRWVKLGKPAVLSLSANDIAKEWKIIKSERTMVVVPVEKRTTRAYVARLLNKLHDQKRIVYEKTKKTAPKITLNCE